MPAESDRVNIADRLEEFGAAARARLAPFFARAGLSYPPQTLSLVVLKAEGTLTLYAPPAKQPLRCYKILGQSGGPGPKLREGDRQVPEGCYRIELLNPASKFHVSLRLNYPNEFDLRMARADGRSEPGSDIYVHGGTASAGCLAMGDEVIEELFTLAADVGLTKIQVIIAPDDQCDLANAAEGAPDWLPELYGVIRAARAGLQAP